MKGAAVLDAYPGLGKTTAAVTFGRAFHRRQLSLYGPTTPGGHERIPVVYLGLTANTTMRSLNAMLCRFYAHPGSERGNALQLANRASDCVLSCGTRLVIVDDVHFLDMGRRDGREVANHFKWLGNQFPVTFLFVGVLRQPAPHRPSHPPAPVEPLLPAVPDRNRRPTATRSTAASAASNEASAARSSNAPPQANLISSPPWAGNSSTRRRTTSGPLQGTDQHHRSDVALAGGPADHLRRPPCSPSPNPYTTPTTARRALVPLSARRPGGYDARRDACSSSAPDARVADGEGDRRCPEAVHRRPRADHPSDPLVGERAGPAGRQR